MIDVKQRRLRPFVHHVAVAGAQLREKQRHVADPRTQPLAVGDELIAQRLPVERRFLDDLIARMDVLADFVRQRVAIAEQIAHADAATADLVLVRRPDTTRCGADLPLAAPRFRQHIQLAVVREDDVRLLADQQPPVNGDAHPGQLVDLLEERLRIDHDAVADDAGDARMQNAGRDEMEDELGSLHQHRVAGVMPALVARDRRKVRRQHVDDLPFALVAPLRAQHCDVHGVYRIFVETSRTSLLWGQSTVTIRLTRRQC